MPNQPRPTLVATTRAPAKALPAGVCARWAAFVAERGAVEAVARIALDCDSLLEQTNPDQARTPVVTPDAEWYSNTAWRMGGDVSTHGM